MPDSLNAQEGLARVLTNHRRASHWGGNGMWEIKCACSRSTGVVRFGTDDVLFREHQATAIVAYLTSDEAVERAAVAVQDRDGTHWLGGDKWETARRAQRQHARNLARAAIRAALDVSQ